jgi:hypothetical protein
MLAACRRRHSARMFHMVLLSGDLLSSIATQITVTVIANRRHFFHHVHHMSTQLSRGTAQLHTCAVLHSGILQGDWLGCTSAPSLCKNIPHVVAVGGLAVIKRDPFHCESGSCELQSSTVQAGLHAMW